jgi:hypothetical protein
MKGQSESMALVMLFIIGLALFTTATVWSRGIFEQNVDVARIENAERFIKDLDEGILNVIKFGGSREIKYDLDGFIALIGNQTIEYQIPVTITLPNNWFNISSSNPWIRERLDGDTFKIQLIYPDTNYKVELFSEGANMTKPYYVLIEGNKTYTSGLPVIKIRITFY